MVVYNNNQHNTCGNYWHSASCSDSWFNKFEWKKYIFRTTTYITTEKWSPVKSRLCGAVIGQSRSLWTLLLVSFSVRWTLLLVSPAVRWMLLLVSPAVCWRCYWSVPQSVDAVTGQSRSLLTLLLVSPAVCWRCYWSVPLSVDAVTGQSRSLLTHLLVSPAVCWRCYWSVPQSVDAVTGQSHSEVDYKWTDLLLHFISV